MEASRVSGPITRWTSRAWNSHAICPLGSFRTMASAVAARSPERDQRVRSNGLA
jgi:hypothetical protein